MTGNEPISECRVCNARLPRSEMFGLEPDLLCPNCAHGVRQRMQIRIRKQVVDRAPVVTIGILGIAVGLFALDLMFPLVKYVDADVWPAWFRSLWVAIHPGPWLWDGEVWRLLTCALLHGGWVHMIFNGIWTWQLGRAVESGFGRTTLLLLFIGSAMFASGLEAIVNAWGVGLSGAIYAIAFFLFVHHRTNAHAARIMNRRTINLLTMWFFLCIALTMSGTWNIANWAHGGGAVWGFAVGHATLHAKRRLLIPLAAVLTIAFVAAVPFVTFGDQTLARQRDQLVKSQGIAATRAGSRTTSSARFSTSARGQALGADVTSSRSRRSRGPSCGPGGPPRPSCAGAARAGTSSHPGPGAGPP